MAQRRMFSPEIVCGEEFLDMPPSAQNLYFHLAMRADDDGFVQPNLIMRTVGSNRDDLKVLLSKRFLLSFESGVVVIKHWLIHNMIRLDRYKTTRFQDEKKALYLKENKAYTDNSDNGVPLLATKWQPNDNQPAPQVRLGKVRLPGQTSLSENENDQVEDITVESEDSPPVRKTKTTPLMRAIFSVFDDNPERKVWHMREVERTAAQVLEKDYGLDVIIQRYAVIKKHRKEEYCPQIFKPSEMLAKMPHMENFLRKL